MFDYENGLLFAFLLWLAYAVLLVISINSRLERNLNRMGQRLSWFTLTPKQMDVDDQSRSTLSKVLKYLFIVGISFPFIFLSWVYVAMSIGTFIKRRSVRSRAPGNLQCLNHVE